MSPFPPDQEPASDPLRSMVACLELSTDRLEVISGAPSDPRALVLVRDEGRVLAVVELDGAAGAAERARQATRGRVAERAWNRGADAGTMASVVICTVGRNPLLTAAVEAALAQDHTRLEVIVVDNAPGRGRTRQMLAGIDDPRLRVVDQPATGLSRARNTGVAVARGEVIAFTDDDAVTDPRWLSETLDVLAADPGRGVGAVTGNPLPARLRHPAQRYFEARGGFPRTEVPVLWVLGQVPGCIAHLGRPGDGGPLYPLTTARVGAGVSMAFRRETLDLIGPFDERLGAGTRTAGGEDLDVFARVLRAGRAIVQTPDAVVWHSHRATLGGLRTQVRGNGTGMAALLTKAVLSDPRALVDLVGRSRAVARRLAPDSPRVVGRDPDVPGSLTRTEVLGFLTGPAQFLIEGLRVRRARGRSR
ncbi:MAG: glycosyltransferase family 2 protein [Actinomyces sp.]|uniref:glycosyltransferase family 2 protein n=1 Tax=Actinomyces sp. TaxID=29317 RepID=UPI0026DCA2F3|nr:glycosyltransferase family 2 protein [Actinomyces sp.]MDO4244205.1 glycosyltransferase family 2 protein [Actinomyces sp.]